MKRGLGWSVVSMIIGAIGSLIVTPVLIHTLGPAEFGLYLLVLAVTSYAGFLDFGITWAAARYFAEDIAAGRSHDLSSRFHTLARFFCGVGVFSVLLAIVFGPVLVRAAGAAGGGELALAFFLAAASFGFVLQSGLVASVLRAAQRFDHAGRVAVVTSFLLPVGSYAVARLTPGLLPLLAINAGVSLIGMLLGLFVARPQLSFARNIVRWQPRYLREMASFGGWSSVSRVVMTAMLQVDRLAVALLGSIAGVTYYAVPANLASRMNALGSPMAGLFFSRASLLHAKEELSDLRRQHARATRFLTCFAVCAALPLMILGPQFLCVWIGPEMAEQGGNVLISLTLGYAVISVASLDAVLLEACGRPDLTAKAMLAWSGVAVTSVLVLTPSLGFRGIAYSMASWLAGLGITDVVMARRVLSGWAEKAERFPLPEAFLLTAAGIPLGFLLRPAVRGLPSALASIGGLGAALLTLGFFVILTAEDRGLVLGTAQRLLRSPLSEPLAPEPDREASCK